MGSPGNPLLVMLAGPNGAGKSTFYEAHLAGLGLPFLNADILSRRTGMGAYDAAEAIAALRDAMVERKEGFIVETVFSDPVGDKVRVLAEAVGSGFEVLLIFIGIEGVGLCRRRVEARVKAGGHDVPPDKLGARYGRTLSNLERAIALLPRVMIYDNSSYERPFRFLAECRSGTVHRRGGGTLPRWARRFVDR